MRINEITSAQDQLDLLRVIIDNTWSAIQQQADIQARQQASKVRNTKPKKAIKAAKRPIYVAQPKPPPKPQQLATKPNQANIANLKQANTQPKANKSPEGAKDFQSHSEDDLEKFPQTTQKRAL